MHLCPPTSSDSSSFLSELSPNMKTTGEQFSPIIRFHLVHRFITVWRRCADRKHTHDQSNTRSIDLMLYSQSKQLRSCHGRSHGGQRRASPDHLCRTDQPPPGPWDCPPVHSRAWPGPGGRGEEEDRWGEVKGQNKVTPFRPQRNDWRRLSLKE